MLTSSIAHQNRVYQLDVVDRRVYRYTWHTEYVNEYLRSGIVGLMDYLRLGYIYSVPGFSAGTRATAVAASPVLRPAESRL